jgi:hypothetical protein
MRVNVYMSGIATTGAPWTQAARADRPAFCAIAESSVRSLSGGSPVLCVTIDVPDEVLAKPGTIEGTALSAEVV